MAQVADLRAHEEHRGGVGAGGDAGAAADAGGRVHGGVGLGLGDRDRVAVGAAAGAHAHEAAGRDDAVEGAAVDHEVAHDRDGARAPRLDEDLVAVPEDAQVELADRRPLARAVRDAVHGERAGAADPLAAVAVEGDRVVAALDQPLVQHVEQLEEGHVGARHDVWVGHEAAGVGAVLLAPDVQRELHHW
jgi:hypothetical protein